jgi:exodeoxyribonuclease VII large subunit
VSVTRDSTITQQSLSVTQVAHRIDSALRDLGDGWIEGEIRSIAQHRSGHIYLTLADEGSNLDACIWKGRAKRCLPLPKQGDLVQAHYERIDFYAPRGATKLIVDEIRPTGEGELLRRRAEVLRRLRADGLCDAQRRKPLRTFPRRIGVIAAQASDAKVDVIRHLHERLPCQDIVFCPATVQGVEAVGSVIDALGRLQAIDDVDVIVLARGGGSVADLIAFDDERLCRAIFACAVPVITSIGHTKDRPNCDHVAAASAPVPAKAAEYAIAQSMQRLLEDFDRYLTDLEAAGRVVRKHTERVADCWRQIRPSQRIAALSDAVTGTSDLLSSRAQATYRKHELALTDTSRALTRLSTRLPRGETLNDARERLRDAAATALSAQMSALQARHDELTAATTQRIPRPAALDVCAVHLANTASRVRERRRDYGRALDRMAGDTQRDVGRRLIAEAGDLDSQAQALRSATERGIGRARERVAHLSALASAKDFRNRGWVLVCDQSNRAVRGLAGLQRGAALELQFADGQAGVTVEHIEFHQQGEGQ